MFSIVWRYNISSAHQVNFEHEYGPAGSWAKLFGKSEAYRGSFLNKDQEVLNTYMLIDTWASQNDYENFLEDNKEEYMQLSKKLAHLYLHEEKTGTYLLIE